MPKLKTFLTKAGFYELAVAAPSMTAALKAWGMTHNAFATGLAETTQDTKIVAAATATPGVVLRRPIGSKSAFQENPDAVKAPRPAKGAKKNAARSKKNQAAIARATAALARGEAEHDRALAIFSKARAKLEEKAAAEAARWNRARGTLEVAITKAKSRN